MATKLGIGSVNGDEYRYRLAEAEVKPQEIVSSYNVNGYQMKVMLNNLIGYKIPSSIVCGILVEGKKRRFKASRCIFIYPYSNRKKLLST